MLPIALLSCARTVPIREIDAALQQLEDRLERSGKGGKETLCSGRGQSVGDVSPILDADGKVVCPRRIWHSHLEIIVADPHAGTAASPDDGKLKTILIEAAPLVTVSEMKYDEEKGEFETYKGSEKVEYHNMLEVTAAGYSGSDDGSDTSTMAHVKGLSAHAGGFQLLRGQAGHLPTIGQLFKQETVKKLLQKDWDPKNSNCQFLVNGLIDHLVDPTSTSPHEHTFADYVEEGLTQNDVVTSWTGFSLRNRIVTSIVKHVFFGSTRKAASKARGKGDTSHAEHVWATTDGHPLSGTQTQICPADWLIVGFRVMYSDATAKGAKLLTSGESQDREWTRRWKELHTWLTDKELAEKADKAMIEKMV